MREIEHGRPWDVAVIGAGVVGLAVGAVLARKKRRVVVLEKQPRPGSVTSSRNSGVIHAGIYYPKGSLKARLCREGRERLLARCVRDGIEHELTGKIIVACDDEETLRLEAIEENARACGVTSLARLSAGELRSREPNLRAAAALWSPESGIVDAHGLLDSYRRELQAHDGDLATHIEVTGFSPSRDGVVVATTDARGEHGELRVARVVNAAGLDAPRIAALAGVDLSVWGLEPRLCKGDYFWLSGLSQPPNTALVYPVPRAGGLGVHLTRDLSGRWRAGPDATYVDSASYDVDEGKATQFAEAVGRYFPAAKDARFAPDFSGIRPKLHGPKEPPADFELRCEGAFIHLLGIESPGLTASEALALEVAAQF